MAACRYRAASQQRCAPVNAPAAGVGFVLSYTTAGAKTRRVLRAIDAVPSVRFFLSVRGPMR